MKMKERIVAVLHHEKPDVIPFTVYTMLLPSRGSGERDLRNMGLGLVELGLSVYGVKTPNVKMQTTEDLALFLRGYRITSTSRQKRLAQRAYTSPAGTVSEKYTLGYTPGLGEWPVEWMIKDLRDYEIVGYMIDDTEYFPDYEEFSKAEEILGDDGIVIPMTPKSPLQSMLLDLMGYERFSIDYQNHRHEIDALYTLFTKKQLEMYKVIADSPAEVILLDDNINGIVTNPKLFERYCMPFYEKVAEIFHQHDKILMVHCDGKLKCLRELIAKSKMDVIEAFTPPPIGDISIEEAMSAWKGKILWANFPATSTLGVQLDRVEEETMNILKSASPGDGFALGVTEDIGDIRSIRYQQVLGAITKTVMKCGKYPISKS
ncbi:MAG: uroporphyrinogen decarboxylase family protein [Candidatus Bathyarchaeia archaeon]|jgi:hypothetical protein